MALHLEPGQRRDRARIALLMVFGVMHVGVGLWVVTFPLSEGITAPALYLQSFGIDGRVSALPWLTTGLAAIVASYWPPGYDGWGFKALAVTEGLWSIVYAGAGILGFGARAWLLALVFACLSIGVTISSNMVSAKLAAQAVTHAQGPCTHHDPGRQ